MEDPAHRREVVPAARRAGATRAGCEPPGLHQRVRAVTWHVAAREYRTQRPASGAILLRRRWCDLHDRPDAEYVVIGLCHCMTRGAELCRTALIAAPRDDAGRLHNRIVPVRVPAVVTEARMCRESG